MKVILAPRAELDFQTQVAWLKLHSPAAGRKAALRIVEMIDLLADFPQLGLGMNSRTREKQFQFGRDGFVIRYRLEDDALIVMRIFHSRQDR
jgi:plasmid stabilization system protein ParE